MRTSRYGCGVNYLAQVAGRLQVRPGLPWRRHSCCNECDPRLRAESVLGAAPCAERDGAHIYGIDAEKRIAERVPTICFNMPGSCPGSDRDCAHAGIGIRDGHMYAPRLMKRMGCERDRYGSCFTRALQHVSEIHRFANVLAASKNVLSAGF